MTCPYCGSGRTPLLVYKHRWWVCPGCGNATSELRADQPGDRLPPWLRDRLPAPLRLDGAEVVDPARQWFVPEHYAAGSAVGTPYAGEAEAFLRLLAQHDLSPRGVILDLSGGPGFVAQALAATADRVVMTDFVPHVVRFARTRLGVDARFYDYQGAPLDTVVEGPFDLVLLRYSINHCLDPRVLARALWRLTADGAAVVIAGFLSPSLGACLTSALEEAPPRVLWDPDWLAAAFVAAGWQVAVRFETHPPMPYWRPRSWRYRVASLPWELRPGPLPRDVHQHHPGLILRRPR